MARTTGPRLWHRVAWPQVLEMVGYREDAQGKQRGIADQRAMLAQHIDRVTVDPVTKRDPHLRRLHSIHQLATPGRRRAPAAPTRLIGPPVNSNSAGGAPPTKPAAGRDA